MVVNLSLKIICFAFTYHPFVHSCTHSFNKLPLIQGPLSPTAMVYDNHVRVSVLYLEQNKNNPMSCYLEIIINFDIFSSLFIQYMCMDILVHSWINSLPIFIKLGSYAIFHLDFFFTSHFEHLPISVNISQKHNFNGYVTFHHSFTIILLDLLISIKHKFIAQNLSYN